MKKLTILFTLCFSVLLLTSCGGESAKNGKEKAKDFKLEVKENYLPGEQAAQQVLLAYRTKDVDLLKEYAGGMMSMALDEDAMDRPDYEEQLNSWDGSIKEMRYDSDVVTFEDVYYAFAHYETNKDDPNKMYVVSLKSRDKEKWVITMNPLNTYKKATFEEKKTALPE